MSVKYETIVVGLGAMGSAALYQLAGKGVKVLGIDRLSPPHTMGSTHGDTRITRQAIGEGAHYTPLSLRSYELIRELETRTKTALLQVTGGLIISNTTHAGAINHIEDFFGNTVAAAEKHGIRHEILDAPAMRTRFPQFNVADDEVGYYEYEAAILRPEAVVKAQLELAGETGADIHTNETFLGFEETSEGVIVCTDKGTYKAANLSLSVGPWVPQVMPQYASLFEVHRQIQYWFDVSTNYESFTPGTFPIFIWQLKGRESGMYGFPAVDGKNGGFKVGCEEYNTVVTPETIDRTASKEEIERVYEYNIKPFFPMANDCCLKTAVCMYTVTADSAFVIDFLPGSKRIVLCSPCSGHGFKHAAAIGESVAQMLMDGETELDLSPFKLRCTA
ncbi:MAG: N-methyl-L-tryptophan oxidase [Cyanobacteria bacterium REEB67]|nr:N-methyl-L-tryptophan oxidase [Cyanobacteria bacterium REEB67]